MTETSTGAPRAAVPDRDRPPLVRARHERMNLLRVVSSVLVGVTALVFAGGGVAVVGSVLVPWRGFSFAGPSVIVGVLLLAIAVRLAQRAWRSTHNLPPVDVTRTPQRQREPFDAERR